MLTNQTHVENQDNPTIQPVVSKYKSILELIGNTPMARLSLDTPATILAKLEYLNPGGSVKDRSALFMVEDAERRGLLKPGGTIIEASSGNQGIALAMIGAVKGYKVIIIVPDRTSAEKVAALKAYGATVVVCKDTDNLEDPDGYHAKAIYLTKTEPNAFMPNQYHNKLNPLAHYTTTGPEIWKQTEGTITHLIVGAGSCGTISGTGKYLKEQNPNIKIIGVDAENSAFSSPIPTKYNVEGLGIDNDYNLDRTAFDEMFPISDENAFKMTREVATKYGFMVGISSGAVMYTLLHKLKAFKQGDVVVGIFADSGRAYLSKVFGL